MHPQAEQESILAHFCCARGDLEVGVVHLHVVVLGRFLRARTKKGRQLFLTKKVYPRQNPGGFLATPMGGFCIPRFLTRPMCHRRSPYPHFSGDRKQNPSGEWVGVGLCTRKNSLTAGIISSTNWQRFIVCCLATTYALPPQLITTLPAALVRISEVL